jgi:16S rRNA (cytidine1402-2'-O)-methyltransferase
MNRNSFGILYIVATPIGNLQDITLRAIEVLKAVNLIVAEDTRHSQSLLAAFSISTKAIALHEHNERDRVAKVLEHLKLGESIALISDAGTPLISDPGYYLVREARAAGIQVVPVPGACAAIAALSASGLPTDRFTFEGFLPAKSGARQQRLEALLNESRTLIFYEAPHRILDLLEDMQKIWGEARHVVLARELTKRFETILSGSLREVLLLVQADANQQRGEMVVIAEGAQAISAEIQVEMEKTLAVLLEELPLKQAVDLTVKITGQKKNDIYEAALRLKNQKSGLSK